MVVIVLLLLKFMELHSKIKYMECTHTVKHQLNTKFFNNCFKFAILSQKELKYNIRYIGILGEWGGGGGGGGVKNFLSVLGFFPLFIIIYLLSKRLVLHIEITFN